PRWVAGHAWSVRLDDGAAAPGSVREQVLQDDGLVVLAVRGAEEQGHATVVGDEPLELLPLLGALELLLVPLGELRETLRVVAEPLTQLGGGADLLEPLVERSVLLAHPAGPDPVDENPVAVTTRRLVADRTDVDLVACGHLRTVLPTPMTVPRDHPWTIAAAARSQAARATDSQTAPIRSTMGRESALPRYMPATAYMPRGKTMLHHVDS